MDDHLYFSTNAFLALGRFGPDGGYPSRFVMPMMLVTSRTCFGIDNAIIVGEDGLMFSLPLGKKEIPHKNKCEGERYAHFNEKSDARQQCGYGIGCMQ